MRRLFASLICTLALVCPNFTTSSANASVPMTSHHLYSRHCSSLFQPKLHMTVSVNLWSNGEHWAHVYTTRQITVGQLTWIHRAITMDGGPGHYAEPSYFSWWPHSNRTHTFRGWWKAAILGSSGWVAGTHCTVSGVH